MCMDFLRIPEQISILNDRVDYYHADVMDGHFCKNITLSPDIIRAFGKIATKPIDCHLMVMNPMHWIDELADAGATYMSVHAETIGNDAFRVLNHIEDIGCKKGVVLNPATPLSSSMHYLNRIDLLTIMTVDVGFAGQPFIPEMLAKIREAKELREKYAFSYEIQIDGSCNRRTYKALADAGADVLVVGSSGLFGLDSNIATAWDKMVTEYEDATE